MSHYYEILFEEAVVLAELLGLEQVEYRESPYAGVEIVNPDGGYITWVHDFAYTKIAGLPGDWVWQGDYWFLCL